MSVSFKLSAWKTVYVVYAQDRLPTDLTLVQSCEFSVGLTAPCQWRCYRVCASSTPQFSHAGLFMVKSVASRCRTTHWETEQSVRIMEVVLVLGFTCWGSSVSHADFAGGKGLSFSTASCRTRREESNTRPASALAAAPQYTPPGCPPEGGLFGLPGALASSGGQSNLATFQKATGFFKKERNRPKY